MSKVKFDNGFFHQKLRGIKVLVLVPHQDDEINLMRDLLVSLQQCGAAIYVAYTTNGDYTLPAAVRYREAIKALDILGIDKKQIIFLGYGDSFNTSDQMHLFNTDSEATTSKAGYNRTYAVEGIIDYSHKILGSSHTYTRENYIIDITLLLEQIQPDIIFAVDYDTHPDHRMLSSGLDSALYRVKRKKVSYSPVVYKGFAYITAYHSYKDFYDSINLDSIKEPKIPNIYHYYGEDDVYGNSIYQWANRVRFPVTESSRGPYLINSILFKAMNAHVSQSFGFKAKAVINSDIVFWQRRTDSVVLNAKLYVSSNDFLSERIRDFKLFEIKDINSLKPSLNPLSWYPAEDDKKPVVQLLWEDVQTVKQVVIYSSISWKNDKSVICNVFLDDTLICRQGILQYGKPLAITFSKPHFVHRLKIEFDKYVEIGEIEVYEAIEQYNPLNPFIKVVKDDNFIYDYYISKKIKTIDVDLYTYMVSKESVQLSVSEGNSVTKAGEKFKVTFGDNQIVLLRAYTDGSPYCYDQVVIHRVSTVFLYGRKILQRLDSFFNVFCMRCRRKWYHLFKK